MAQPEAEAEGGAAARQAPALPAEPAEALLARRLAAADLAEGLAHDLKNLLTVIAASVQLAQAALPPGASTELLQRAFRASMRAAGLLDELLLYARAEGAPRAVPLDAAEAVETAVAAAWVSCRRQGVQLDMRLTAGLPPVAAPATALRLLLLRLLRWMAEQGGTGGRLLVEVAAPSARQVAVGVRLLPAESTGPAERGGSPDLGCAGERAVLQALAAQAGAMLLWTGSDRAVVLLDAVASAASLSMEPSDAVAPAAPLRG